MCVCGARTPACRGGTHAAAAQSPLPNRGSNAVLSSCHRSPRTRSCGFGASNPVIRTRLRQPGGQPSRARFGKSANQQQSKVSAASCRRVIVVRSATRPVPPIGIGDPRLGLSDAAPAAIQKQSRTLRYSSFLICPKRSVSPFGAWHFSQRQNPFHKRLFVG
jgi:hypothetical protein